MILKPFFLIFAVVCLADCLPNFIRGRKFNYDLEQIKLYQQVSNITDLYFDQRLDHFNEAIRATWKQRYWINDQFFDGNGPVFIMIGGEGEENPIWMTHGTWIDFASKFNALCVLLEHRFYGKSHPTEDLSTENLKYLSSEQGLADLASFRNFIHSKFNLTNANKWISFGGSYPGSLSAWFRLKYPHLVHAAVSSSAPMLALINFTDYMVVVNQSLNSYHSECPIQLQQATNQVIQLMQSQSGRQNLQQLFKTCDPIVTDDDVTNFYSAISGNFEGAVQYNKDNRAFEGAKDTSLTIDLLCDTMLNGHVGDPLRRYAAVNEIILNTYDLKCLDASYSSFIDQMKQTNWNQSAAVGGRQWTYQTCVEFGFFQSTDSPKQPFGNTVPAEFYIKQCQDIFGKNFDVNLLEDSILNTNINYGGYDYESSRVVFVNGKVDPWHALGFYNEPPNQYTEKIFIDGTAHCADMYPAADTDLPQLTEARLRIFNLINDWLLDD